MADAEHLRVLLGKGVAAWNQLRETKPVHPDFSRANLSEAELARANLRYAELRGAVLRKANLYGADLFEATLGGADLRWADFRCASLQNANLTGAVLQATRFEKTNLRFAKGLDSCQHLAPSSVDYWPLHTLLGSEEIPRAFLRGCGLGNEFIEYLISLWESRTQACSCFITYSAADRPFARRLHDALQSLGIRCWLDERQIVPDKSNQVGAGRRLWDRELLCCSAQSLTSSWIADEFVAAAEGEREFETQILSLLDIDGYLFSDRHKGAQPTAAGFEFRRDDIYWRSRLVFDFIGSRPDNRTFDEQVLKIAKLINQPLHPILGTSLKEVLEDQTRRRAKDAAAAKGCSMALAEVEIPHFTVYYSGELSCMNGSTLLAYAHVESVKDQISEDAYKLLEGQPSRLKKHTSVGTRGIQRGASITVVPYLPNCHLSPRLVTFCWLENWHRAEFSMTLESPASAADVRGSVDFYVGPVMLASVPLLVKYLPSASTAFQRSGVHASATAYEAVFVSYSHKDSRIVDELENAYRVLGFEYLRDVRNLRAGQKWNEALLHLIERADIFQLCWSRAAMCSPYVEREWRHAWKQERSHFIRPMFWEQPMPPPPEELRDVHFAYFELPRKVPWLRRLFST